jgi:hypothetical protein
VALQHPSRADDTAEVQYTQSWKQLIYFTLRTGLLDEDVRQFHYGIEFTPAQLQIILQLAELLEEYNEDGYESSLESDQHPEEEEEEEELGEVDFPDDDDDNDNDNDEDVCAPSFMAPPPDDDDGGNSDKDAYISLKVKVAEKLLQLSVESLEIRCS